MNTSTSSESKIDYTLREDGIHEFTLHDASMTTVDAYYAMLEPIYDARPANASEPIRMIMNVPKKSLPFNYMMKRANEIMAKYPNLGTICSATITSNIAEARIADTFMRIIRLPGVRVRFFPTSERDKAIKWLLEQT